ncbi:MAG: hypothetical protein K6G42_11640 [Lachnospiraceae bacterium]|nr:hypothetical protein [Lachnospiraceae bacterium]
MNDKNLTKVGYLERRYRVEEAKQKLDDIMNDVNGRNTDLCSLICDKNGKPDNRKINMLIDEMVDTLGTRKWGKASEDEKEFYRCFLYCCIVGPSHESHLGEIEPDIIPARTLNDIIIVARSEHLKLVTKPRLSPEDIATVNHNCRTKYNVFKDKVDELTLALQMPPCLGAKYGFEFMDPLLEYNFFTMMEVVKDWVDLGRVYKYPDFNDLDEDEQPYWYEQSKWHECNKRWFASLPKKGKELVDKYEKFIVLYRKVDHMDMGKQVEDMVDEYLFSSGISPLSLGDEYGLIDDSLKRSGKIVHKSIMRARTLSKGTSS